MSSNYSTKRVRQLGGYADGYDTDETNEIVFWLGTILASTIQDEATREFLLSGLGRRDLLALCEFCPDYERLTAPDAAAARQVGGFFAKRSDLDLGVDRAGVALSSFMDAESACAGTNTIFRSWSRGEFAFAPRVEGWLFAAQRKIAKILGDVPTLDQLKFRFGPGATTGRRKRDAHARYKLGDVPACSANLLPMAGELLAEFPGWVFPPDHAGESINVSIEIHDAKVQFVPKSYKTDRTICVEPILNGLFQLGVGDYIAARLGLYGVDISDQSRNQKAAREGSLTGALATLDLSSASDTIATELVAHLLPPDWFTFLSFGRSAHCVLPNGERLRQEKFCSMGNGFTFPLETLIFYALADSVCEGYEEKRHVRAYGDDIIVPSHRFRALSGLLHVCGFTVNPKKSFYYGAFRESCGSDYLLGKQIRPAYLKGPLTAASVFVLHNHFFRLGVASICAALRGLITRRVRLFGPDGYGDGHFLTDTPPLQPHNRDRGWGGYVFETWVSKARSTLRLSRGDHVFPGYCVYLNHPLCEEAVRWDYRREAPISLGRGPLRVTLPGTSGHKRVSVYTLNG